MTTKSEYTSKDWFGKTSAAVILGFLLTIAITAIFSFFAVSKDSFFSAQGQIAMWLVAPIWSMILGFCFFFRSGPRAWGWLALANIICWAFYAALRLF